MIDAVHDLDGEDEYLDEVRSVLEVDEPVVVSEFVGGARSRIRARRCVGCRTGDVVDATVAICGRRAGGDRRRRDAGAGAVVHGLVAAPARCHQWPAVVVRPFACRPFRRRDGRGDDEFLVAAGALRDVDDADDDEIARRLGDPDRVVDRAQAKALYARIAPHDAVLAVRAVRHGDVVVVDAADAVIVDAPDLLPLLGDSRLFRPQSVTQSRVADALDIALASELASFEVLSNGVAHDDHMLHEALLVRDVDGQPQQVSWRVRRRCLARRCCCCGVRARAGPGVARRTVGPALRRD